MNEFVLIPFFFFFLKGGFLLLFNDSEKAYFDLLYNMVTYFLLFEYGF